MERELYLIKTAEQAVQNIVRLNTFLAEHPMALNRSISSVRRWYAARVDGCWRFGFSKFIGYADMTPELYDDNLDRLRGGRTERALNSLSMTVDASSPLFASLSSQLHEFLTTLGRDKPSSNATISFLLTLPTSNQSFIEARTTGLPRATEAEQLVIRRIGQDVFRESLMRYWGGRCPMTGVAEPELLRASHIIPWAQCESDVARLDVHNGLLLSALWDAAFDSGLATFDDTGTPLFSTRLSEEARARLTTLAPLPLTEAHRAYMAWHRQEVFEPSP
ncbi:MAG: HNH endonuclease [Pikeienuella sp.]|uniref:HNH endonuclease n=1 Tax=Pikeienuella sp. TaxID=2831957 RepID=UPI00391DC8ED